MSTSTDFDSTDMTAQDRQRQDERQREIVPLGVLRSIQPVRLHQREEVGWWRESNLVF